MPSPPRLENLEDRIALAFNAAFNGQTFELTSDNTELEVVSVTYNDTSNQFEFTFNQAPTGAFTTIVGNTATLSATDAIANNLTTISIRGGATQPLNVTVGNLTGADTDIQTFRFVSATGGAGNDTMDATGQINGVIAMAFDGAAADDTILGGAGNDTLTGGGGNDSLDGGGGIDRVADSGSSSFTLTSSSLTGNSTGTDTLSNIEEAFLEGTSGNDLLDAQQFFNGSVTLRGLDGNDTLIGGFSNDALFGGNGIDQVRVVGGNTILTDNLLSSSFAGSDSLSGIEQASVSGASGDDSIDASGFSGTTTIVGSDGNDTLIGGSGTDYIFGGIGNDSIVGNAGNDSLLGEDGDDTITGNAGSDTLSGDSGFDTFFAADNEADFLFVDSDEIPTLVDDVNFDDGLDFINGVRSSDVETLSFDDIVGVTDLTGKDTPYNLDFSRIGSGLILIFGDGTGALPPGVTDYIIFDSDLVQNIVGGNGDDLFKLVNGATIGGGSGSLNGLGGTDTIDYTEYGSPAFAMTPTGSATGTGGIVSIEIALGISGSEPPEQPEEPEEPEEPPPSETPQSVIPAGEVFGLGGTVDESSEHVSQQGRHMAGTNEEDDDPFDLLN